MTTRNPPWARDELILALDLYVRLKPSGISDTHQEVKELSDILRRLPIHTDRPDPNRFRNPNGVSMKLSNFLRFDPEYHGKGLQAGSQGEEVIWREFASDRERLRRVAAAIRAGIPELTTSGTAPLGDGTEGEFDAPEGRVLLTLHKRRERNPSLVAKKKQQVMKRTGTLACEVCAFDFGKVYGCVGEGFIECHHTAALSRVAPGHRTRLDDLCLVCSNCHRMLHRGGEALTVEALREHLTATLCRGQSSGTPQRVQ